MKIAHPLSLEVNPYESSFSLGDVSPRSCHDRTASTTTTTGKREEETTHTAQGGKGKQVSPPPQNKSLIDWQRTYLKRTWGCSAAVMAESGVLLTLIFKRNTDFLFLFQLFPAFAAINRLSKSTTFVLPVWEYQPLESATLADVWFLPPQVSPYKFRLDTAPPSPSNESDQAQGFSSWMGVLGQDIHGYSRKVQQRNIWKMRPQLWTYNLIVPRCLDDTL